MKRKHFISVLDTVLASFRTPEVTLEDVLGETRPVLSFETENDTSVGHLVNRVAKSCVIMHDWF